MRIRKAIVQAALSKHKTKTVSLFEMLSFMNFDANNASLMNMKNYQTNNIQKT